MGQKQVGSSNATRDGSSRRSKAVDNIKCPNCAGPLSKNMETSQWTISPLIRDSFSMIGSAVGGIASAFYGFNHVMPIVQRRIKGPMLMHFLVGAPPVLFSLQYVLVWQVVLCQHLLSLHLHLIMQWPLHHPCILHPHRMII